LTLRRRCQADQIQHGLATDDADEETDKPSRLKKRGGKKIVVKRSGDHDDEEGGGGGGGASKKRKQDDAESQHPITITLPIPKSSWEESKLVETQERLQKMVFIHRSFIRSFITVIINIIIIIIIIIITVLFFKESDVLPDHLYYSHCAITPYILCT
jgi:hypothetical protein